MIPSRRLLAAITVVVVLVATPALAGWVVARVSQPARYAVDGESWRALAVGMEVPNHAWIHTGRTGRLLLRDAGDVIQFKPNTVAAVSRGAGGGAAPTTILQKFGSLLVLVEPHPSPSMSVETPYLALIVKGTRFEVEVARSSVETRVHEGVVEVTHLALGRRAHVYPGQLALAQGNRRFAVRGGGPEPRIVAVEPRGPRVSPATPAREPVAMSAPHSGSDSRGEAERARDRRELEARELLNEALREREKTRRDKKRDRDEETDRDEEKNRDDRGPPDKKDDGEPQDDDPGGDVDDPDTGGDGGPDTGNPEEEPDIGSSEEEDEEPAEESEPGANGGFDDTLAPDLTPARATRRG